MKRFIFLLALLFPIAGCTADQDHSAHTGTAVTSTSETALTTYKSATCGCCKLWVEHARDKGLDVTAVDADDLNAIKQRHGISPAHQSCHTTVAPGGYVFEGHIPAKYIRQFLQNPPQNARGLTVPAMPLGSPGMEVGDRFTPYRVWQLNKDGSHTLYADIQSAADQY